MYYKFQVENTTISGYVTACTFEDAIEIMSNVHLGSKKIITINFEGQPTKVIQGAAITIYKEPINELPLQNSCINGEQKMSNIHGADCSYKGKAKSGVMPGSKATNGAKLTGVKVTKLNDAQKRTRKGK